MKTRVLVAGLGNIFLGDDAFGVEVVRRLAQRAQPAGVRIADFGIRGIDLAYALMDGVELAILVDALPRGHSPGTLVVLDPELEPGETSSAEPLLDGHGMNPMKVLRMVRALGGVAGTVRIVGCEPAPFDPDVEDVAGLSPAVEAALDPAVELVEQLIRAHLADAPQEEVTIQARTKENGS
jgi:hydrogenase maturation protease